MLPYRILSLIIHYNNPVALKKTVDRMVTVGFFCENIYVIDNASMPDNSDSVKLICKEIGICFIQSELNRGWGAAINYFIDARSWADNDLLLISAHDARIEKFNEDVIVKHFDNSQVAFVCPQYPDALICKFSLLRSFNCRPLMIDESNGNPTVIGHATLCIARPSIIKKLRFDEEYFIYGCESEIFLRCIDHGFKIVVMNDFVVSNPSTDSNSDFVTRAFTINSIYTAKKRAGYLGFLLRSFVVLISSQRLVINGQISQARVKMMAALWSIKTGGKGYRSFLKLKKHLI